MHKSRVLTPEYFIWLAEELKFDLVAFMIDSSDRDPKFLFSERDAERTQELAYPRATDVVFTTWPYPDKDQIDAQCAQMDALLKAAPRTAAWETDEEFNWDEDMVRGFSPVKVTKKPQYVGDVPILPSRLVPIGGTKSPFDVAGDYFVFKKCEICNRHGVRNEMTTLPYHQENGPKADTIEGADTTIVQAYACDERDGKEIPFEHRLGPGNMQRLTLDRTKIIPAVMRGETKLGVGHAAWKQRFNRRNPKTGEIESVPPKESMQLSLDTAMGYPVVDHRWWADKFAYPKSARYLQYAETFLTSLRQ